MMASNKKAWHDFHSERKGIEAPPLEEPLGGYIFVCNDETMANDIQRNLFGMSAISSNMAEILWLMRVAAMYNDTNKLMLP